MIQRVQTLFLLAVSALLFSMFFSKMAFTAEEVVRYREIGTLLTMTIATFALSFISIFLYKNRVIQMRVSVINLVLLLGFQGLIIAYFVKRPEESIFTISGVFPIVAAILTFTAIRYIARDEAMVRATSRLRK